ncbi:MAG: ATP-dependent Clp protease ATP-binding subunit, partial [Deltaproteobacteria bacterium]|nr:ATP-dependent Clp protease ATP-binding subunit [Deltaproteobacteria bacterium]
MKLSAAARLAWQIAAAEAAMARHPLIEREHLLIGLCSLHKTMSLVRFVRAESLPMEEIRTEADHVEEILSTMGISSSTLRRGVRSRLRPGHARHTDQVVHRSDACKEIFRRGKEISDGGETPDTSSSHLLAAILSDPGPIITAVLAGAGIQSGQVPPESLSPPPPKEKGSPGPVDVGTMVSEPETAEALTPVLDRYGRDITRAAREGRLLPFVESERTRNTLRQLLKVLVMPTKNNPVLVGEAGVGKTAIVEALAERVATGRDRRVLAG